MIEVRELVKAYEGRKDLALKGINLDVGRGECFGLLGPNGAGKTTLMGCMLGLLHPDGGTIRIDGLDPNDLAVRETLGFLPERPFFESWFTARQFIAYHHALSGGDRKKGKQKVEAVLDMVRLEPETRDRKINKFSRGMLQRLGLAQALIGDPAILFLDEPGSGMDPPGVALLRELLIELKQKGVTIVLNSHHLDEMERVCDRVAFIRNGEIDSIKAIADGDDLPHVLRIKWLAGAEEEGLEKRLAAEILPPGAALLELTERSARISVENSAVAAATLKAMVHAAIEVQSASPESTTLERLFDKKQ
ncbi:MAG: ABC transporter ATP-binding protein [Candidatus Melainabacteria bacterium]|nr:ABC transporter ATP-binding protein [Candidatus Melainabacteria bacterium]